MGIYASHQQLQNQVVYSHSFPLSETGTQYNSVVGYLDMSLHILVTSLTNSGVSFAQKSFWTLSQSGRVADPLHSSAHQSILVSNNVVHIAPRLRKIVVMPVVSGAFDVAQKKIIVSSCRAVSVYKTGQFLVGSGANVKAYNV